MTLKPLNSFQGWRHKMTEAKNFKRRKKFSAAAGKDVPIKPLEISVALCVDPSQMHHGKSHEPNFHGDHG